MAQVYCYLILLLHHQHQIWGLPYNLFDHVLRHLIQGYDGRNDPTPAQGLPSFPEDEKNDRRNSGGTLRQRYPKDIRKIS